MADKSVRFGLFADDDASAKFDRVGQAAEGAGRKMRDSGESAKEYGKGLDRSIEAADTADTRAMGFRDSLTGVQDSMKGTALIAKGDLFNGFLTLGMGVGDLASGFANFLLPALGKFSFSAAKSAVTSRAAALASKVWAAGQWVLNAALSANPIGLIIVGVVALAAAFIIAYKRSATFRAIVQGAFAGVRAAAGAVAGFFTGPVAGAFRFAFSAIQVYVRTWWSVMSTAARGVRQVFEVVGGAIAAPFRAAFAGIRAAWNSTIGGRGFSVPDWVPGIGGKGFTIPYLAKGGIVTRPTLAMIGEAGPEAVVPLGRGGTGFGGPSEVLAPVVLQVDGKVLHQVLLRIKRGNGGAALGLA